MEVAGPDQEWLTRVANDPQLTTLSLRGKNIGDDGVRALAAALGENNTLTSLDLELCNITDEGARVLAGVFETNATLTSVDLANNSIGDPGAHAIAAALHKNTTLTSINLESNNIDVEGTTYLLVFPASAPSRGARKLLQQVASERRFGWCWNVFATSTGSC